MTKNVLSVSGIILLAGFALVVFFLLPFEKQRDQYGGLTVRVSIARDFDSAYISSDALCDVIKPSTGEVLLRSLDLSNGAKVNVRDGRIRIEGAGLEESSLRVFPQKDTGFSFDGKEYWGVLDISAGGDRSRAINRVELEDYLKGVVPREVYHFWPMSVLKAQAVASRSYAVFESIRRRKREYDLTSDTFTQVYGGKSAERPRTTNAVILTRGEVLKFDGKLIAGYFHSSCGGHTADVSKGWGGQYSEHFKGVRSPYCRWSPPFRWKARITTAAIIEKLNASGYGFGSIDDIKHGRRDNSSRLECVRIRSRNKWFEIPIRDFMSSIGRASIRSSNFRVRKYPRFYDFDGYGWGHGVGMCQWCSFGLSLRRWSYERILEHFYPGAKVSDIGKWQAAGR